MPQTWKIRGMLMMECAWAVNVFNSSSTLSNSSLLASKEEFDKVDEELKTFTAQAHSIISMPRIFQVWGMK